MITKIIELNGSEIAINDNYRKIVTGYGLSTDEKPIDGYKTLTGSWKWTQAMFSCLTNKTKSGWKSK